MELILKQRIVGSIVIIAILSIILPVIVISKDEVFNKTLISNIPTKPVFKISLPETAYQKDVVAFKNSSIDKSDKVAQDTSQKPSINISNTLLDKKQTKQVALFIPLSEKENAANAGKESEKPSAPVSKNKNASNANESSSKLVASAPKGELSLPDLANIGKALEKFVSQSSSEEEKVNAKKDISASKKQNSAANRPMAKSSATAKLSKPLPTPNTLTTAKSSKISAGWVVQVGSFSKRSNATKLQNKLAKRGHNSYVEPVKSKNGVIYRVRVGPQKDQSRAKSVQQKILKQDKLESIVLRFPHN